MIGLHASEWGGKSGKDVGGFLNKLGAAESDVVVICLPLTKATHHLFSRDLFRRMKPTAILINVTRGAIVYGDDLMAALNEGLIWGAGLDVTDPEPLPAGHPLWTHPRRRPRCRKRRPSLPSAR